MSEENDYPLLVGALPLEVTGYLLLVALLDYIKPEPYRMQGRLHVSDTGDDTSSRTRLPNFTH